MKRVLTIVGLLLVALIAAAIIKLIIPLSYAQIALRPDALRHVAELQVASSMTPEAVAVKYLFFRTDYQNEVPERIEISSSGLNDRNVRVRIYDPSCRDDSVHSSIDRIYLRRTKLGAWEPYKVDFSHTGRGHFGWTTKPTS